jgi:hypothetical protein
MEGHAARSPSPEPGVRGASPERVVEVARRACPLAVAVSAPLGSRRVVHPLARHWGPGVAVAKALFPSPRVAFTGRSCGTPQKP